MSIFNTPLLGDAQGNYKIYIVGNSGTGKTTLGAHLSAKLNSPHVSLDEIAWKPGWQMMEADELKDTVRTWIAEHNRCWIIDGNYRTLGTLIPDDATDIICGSVTGRPSEAVYLTYLPLTDASSLSTGLDPPLYYYLPRLLWRTLMRLLGFRPSCAAGCEETWAGVFSTKGIVWFCITNHDIVRTHFSAWLARMGVERGGKMIRLDESCGELDEWKHSLEARLRRT